MQAFAQMGQEGGNVAARNLESQLEQIEFARRIGVQIALGTDAGSPGVYHGDSVIKELGLLLDAGFSVEQAVHCATSNGAELLGLTHLGNLAPGLPAFFIAAPGSVENIPKSLKQIQVFRPAGGED
jgi:imidazolonepropionase-like amidohydrolase